MDTGLLAGDLVNLAAASVVGATRIIALAQDVWLVYIFLCRAACHGLVLVGSGFGIKRDACGRMEKTFHHGGDGGISHHVAARADLNQRLDATTGAQVAADPQIDLSDWPFIDPALLVAQIRQKRFHHRINLCVCISGATGVAHFQMEIPSALTGDFFVLSDSSPCLL